MADAFSAVLNAAIYHKNKKAIENQYKQQSDLSTTLATNARTLSPYIGEFYGRAKEAYDPVAEHYRALASGDRSQIMPAIANQTRGVQDKYGSIIAANRELNPRSGAGAAYNTDLGFRAGDQVQGIENAEVAGAYPTLGKLAGVAGDLGAGAAGVATNAGVGASGIGSASLANRYNSMGAGSMAYGNLFNSFYGAYKDYMKNAGDTAGGGAAGGAASGAGKGAGSAGADVSTAQADPYSWLV